MEPVDFERAVAAYQEGLTTRLRGFVAGPAFLESWVPDPDPVKALVNMAEAAEACGLRAFTVHLDAATLPPAGRAELQRRLGRVGIEERGERLILDVEVGHAPVLAEAHVERAPRRDSLPPETPSSAGAYDEPAVPLRHQGTLPSPFSASEGGATLAIAVDGDHRITEARHQGGDGFHEALCEVLEGLPVQEAADHAVIRLERRLRDRSGPPPVAGVITPESADPRFAALTRLVRAAVEKYRAAAGLTATGNEFDAGPGAAWRSLGPEGQRARVQAVLDEERAELSCVAVESERVIVRFTAEVERRERPRRLREIERVLKRRLDGALYLSTPERYDSNRLRRLGE